MINLFLSRTSLPLQSVKFCIVGSSGIVVNCIILILLYEIAGLPLYLASMIAVECSILSNFLINNAWTFREQGSIPFYHKLLLYNAVACVGMLINVSMLTLLTHFVNIHYLIANLAGIGAAFFWNFTSSKYLVWKN